MKNTEKQVIFLTFWAALRPPVAKTMCFSMFSRGMFQNTCVFLCFWAERLAPRNPEIYTGPLSTPPEPLQASCLGNNWIVSVSGIVSIVLAEKKHWLRDVLAKAGTRQMRS